MGRERVPSLSGLLPRHWLLRLSGLFSRNWFLKLSAFVVALLLWVAVRTEAPTRQELREIPVEVALADPGWVVAGAPSPATVNLLMSGSSRELLGVTVDRPTLVIPIDRVTAADTTVVLRSAWVRLEERPGVVVEGIEPPSIVLSLEPVQGVILPVAARVRGELPPGLALAGPFQLFPEGVRVSGPESRFQGLDSARLVPVDLAGVTAPGRISVPVDTANLEGLLVRPAAVELELHLEERVERVMSGIPIVLPPGMTEASEPALAAPRLELLPRTASVIIRGARSLVDRTDPTRFALVVRIEPGEVPPPGTEAEFPVALEGLPPLVGGELQQSVVTVRNLAAGRPP